MSETVTKLRELPVAERLRLLEDVWESLSDPPEAVDMPEWHRAELDRRIESRQQHPGGLLSWDAVKADILKDLKP